ncbi:MAG TPA: hypothetical protein VI362_06710 [Ignavibacteriaceae bacterium]|nr:hypothetical protein [Ignavibacteriaceae bacterium]
MKKIFFVCLFVVFGLISCSVTENEFMNNGIITGPDVRECSCCGGYFIDIDDKIYRFYSLPDNNSINLIDVRFPVYVKLDWKNDEEACLGDEIIVLRIDKQ